MRFFACLLATALILTTHQLGAQENARPQETRPQDSRPHSPHQPTPPSEPQAAPLDQLFERLAKTGSELEAKGIASLIERRFARSGSDTADLLLNRAGKAFEDKNYPLAVELLDRVVTLQPNWAQAWYRRATVFYQLDDPVGAMADLHRALKLEPRHFEAWTGLGHILMASDDKARALEAYRRALKINPQESALQTLVTRLGPDVDGQDL